MDIRSPSRDLYEAMRGDARIDVIIPAHNARQTLARTLASIAAQTIVSDVDVIVVDDASDESYDDIIARYAHFMSIRLIRIDAPNRFPGYARQLGMDSSDNAFITFIDADDTYADAFSLARLFHTALMMEDCHVVCGAFAGVINEWCSTSFIAHREDRVHVFSKLYRRSFLKENGIRFNTDAAGAQYNEDYGFNAPIFLCFAENTLFLPDIVYHWHENPGSLTRSGDPAFQQKNMTGLAHNMIFAFEKCLSLRAEGKTAVSAAFLLDALPHCFVRLFDACCKAQAAGFQDVQTLFALTQTLYRRAFLPLAADSPQAAQSAEACLLNLGRVECKKHPPCRADGFEAFWEGVKRG